MWPEYVHIQRWQNMRGGTCRGRREGGGGAPGPHSIPHPHPPYIHLWKWSFLSKPTLSKSTYTCTCTYMYFQSVHIHVYMLFHALLWNMASYFTSDVQVFSRAETRRRVRIQHTSETTSHIPQQITEQNVYYTQSYGMSPFHGYCFV